MIVHIFYLFIFFTQGWHFISIKSYTKTRMFVIQYISQYLSTRVLINKNKFILLLMQLSFFKVAHYNLGIVN